VHLLSFFSSVERTLVAESGAAGGGKWKSQRMLDFQHGFGRLTLTPRPDCVSDKRSGAIFVQAFSLANGSLCLKASLTWNGSEALSVITVYPTTTSSWRAEASRIATAWLAGPLAAAAHTGTEVRTPVNPTPTDAPG
jgi:hypothetical protein